MQDNDRLELATGVNYQALGDSEDGVLLSMSSGYLYRCNGSALQILDLVKDRPTYAMLLARFTQRFELDEAQARVDLAEFVQHLLHEQLLAKVA